MPLMHYSVGSLLTNALTGNKHWKPLWREPEPKKAYDVVIIGGGGHGLATAYYLSKEHGITNVAVVEKSYLGSGNVGRNTTIIRSNYLLPGNLPFYEWSMKLWEGFEQDLNYNAMVSQRGVLNVFHSDPQRDAYARRGNAMRLFGVDADLLDRDQVRTSSPSSISTTPASPSAVDCSRNAAARCVMMQSPGAMPAAPILAASTSSRIVRQPVFASSRGGSLASRRIRATSPPRRSRCPAPATHRASRRLRA